VNHSATISSHSPAMLAAAFASMMEKPWAPEALARLYDRAGRMMKPLA